MANVSDFQNLQESVPVEDTENLSQQNQDLKAEVKTCQEMEVASSDLPSNSQSSESESEDTMDEESTHSDKSKASSSLSFNSQSSESESEDYVDEEYIHSDKSKLLRVYRIHKHSIFDEYDQKFSRKPDVEEFLRSYLLKYIEPCGWIGVHKKHLWEQRRWPVPVEVKSLVLVLEINIASLHVLVTDLDMNNLAHQRGEIDASELHEIGKKAYKVPLWELSIHGRMKGALMNLKTFGEALEIYKNFKIQWSLPYQSSVDIHYWFNQGCEVPMDMWYDLDRPGALSSRVRDEIISVFCSIREKERDLYYLEHTRPDAVREEDYDTDDDTKIIYYTMQLESLSPRLKHLTNYLTRIILEEEELGKDQILETEKHALILVIHDNTATFSLLQEMKKVATKWVNAVENEHDCQVDNVEFKIVNSLNAAVSKCQIGSVVLVGPGQHELTNLGTIASGGYLIGVPFAGKNVEIYAQGCGDYWLMVGDQNEVTICNADLIIKASFEEQTLLSGIFLREGAKLNLQNVSLTKQNLDTTESTPTQFANKIKRHPQNGIEARCKSSLKLSGCKIDGFTFAVNVFHGAQVKVLKSWLKGNWIDEKITAEPGTDFQNSDSSIVQQMNPGVEDTFVPLIGNVQDAPRTTGKGEWNGNDPNSKIRSDFHSLAGS